MEKKKREDEEKKKKEDLSKKKKDDDEKKKKEEMDKKKKDEDNKKKVGGSTTSTSKGIGKMKALYDYTAAEVNELSFKEGDIVTLLEKFEDSDWWKGELNGVEGLFPVNFMESVSMQNSSKSTTATPAGAASPISKSPSSSSTSKKLEQFRAIYDYTAQEPNELSFQEGAVITLVEKYPDSDWWNGEVNGKVGLFPLNFTKPL